MGNAAREAVAESQKAYFESAIGKATEAEKANRAKAQAERDETRTAQAEATGVTNLQQQSTMFASNLARTANRQLITERVQENKSTFTGYPNKKFVSPDEMP